MISIFDYSPDLFPMDVKDMCEEIRVWTKMGIKTWGYKFSWYIGPISGKMIPRSNWQSGDNYKQIDPFVTTKR